MRGMGNKKCEDSGESKQSNWDINSSRNTGGNGANRDDGNGKKQPRQQQEQQQRKSAMATALVFRAVRRPW